MTTSEKIILKALDYYGLAEIPGVPSNAEILTMMRKHIPAAEDDSKYGWCGIFMDKLFTDIGRSDIIPHSPVTARNWQRMKGTEIQISQIKKGDIVTFWRDSISDWKGHVAIYINESPQSGYINVLGGNQSNQVSIRPYAISRILKIIRP